MKEDHDFIISTCIRHRNKWKVVKADENRSFLVIFRQREGGKHTVMRGQTLKIKTETGQHPGYHDVLTGVLDTQW